MVDAQSGHEKTITGILPALAGANVIYGLGMLEMGITFDLTQLVIDNEIAEMIKFTLNGIPVNDETLAVNVIREMGIGKDYLSHESTYQHRASQSRAQLMDRRTWGRSSHRISPPLRSRRSCAGSQLRAKSSQ